MKKQKKKELEAIGGEEFLAAFNKDKELNVELYKDIDGLPMIHIEDKKGKPILILSIRDAAELAHIFDKLTFDYFEDKLDGNWDSMEEDSD